MAATITQLLRKAANAEATGQIQPDHSEIIADLADGWTLRALTTAGDFRREAYLMHNCSGMYVPDDVSDDQAFSMSERADLADDQRELVLVSLRDEHNLPHATAWHYPGGSLFSLMGRGNDPLKGHKLARVKAWCEREELEFNGISDGSCYHFFAKRE